MNIVELALHITMMMRTIDHDHKDQYDDGDDDAYYLRMGLIMVNLTNPMQEVNMITSPMLWSRPVPLGNFLFGHVGNNTNAT